MVTLFPILPVFFSHTQTHTRTHHCVHFSFSFQFHFLNVAYYTRTPYASLMITCTPDIPIIWLIIQLIVWQCPNQPSDCTIKQMNQCKKRWKNSEFCWKNKTISVTFTVYFWTKYTFLFCQVKVWQKTRERHYLHCWLCASEHVLFALVLSLMLLMFFPSFFLNLNVMVVHFTLHACWRTTNCKSGEIRLT